MWKLFSDVNNWHTWDQSIEFAKLEWEFRSGNFFLFQPKGGPKLKLQIVEATENTSFTDMTTFPWAKMFGKHTFEDTPDGLKITTTMTVEGFLSPLWVKLVTQKIVDGLPNDIQVQISTASKL